MVIKFSGLFKEKLEWKSLKHTGLIEDLSFNRIELQPYKVIAGSRGFHYFSEA